MWELIYNVWMVIAGWTLLFLVMGVAGGEGDALWGIVVLMVMTFLITWAEKNGPLLVLF